MRIFERKNMNKSAHDLLAMQKNGKLSFDNISQRGLVWKNNQKDNRKSLLIHSMIIGYPIPPMYCNCIISAENIKDRRYDFIDGKQRTTTVCQFLKDEFALINVPLVNIDENADNDEEADDDKLIDVNGKKFSELPDEIQRLIENYQLIFHYYENLSDEEFKEMMFRLNNGKQLTAAEKSRINTKDQPTIMELAKHSVFDKALSSNMLNGFSNEMIVKQTWSVLNIPDVTFDAKTWNPIIEKTIFSDNDKKTITAIFDRLLKAHDIIAERGENEQDEKQKKLFAKIAKRVLGRITISSISPVIKDSIDNGLSEAQLADWMEHFFNGTNNHTTISEKYNAYINGGTGAKTAIATRLSESMNDYKAFIKSSYTGSQSKAETQEVTE